MSKTFSITRFVQFAETDMGGIVHFSQYYRYMEEAEHAFFRSLGLSIVDTSHTPPVSWPRVTCSFDFLAPLRFEDEPTLTITLTRLGSKSISYRTDVTLSETKVATGTATIVCCELSDDGMISRPIPENIRAKLTPYATN